MNSAHRERENSPETGEIPVTIPPGRAHQAGFTLIEMSIAMVLTVVILQVAVSSTLVLNQSTHLGNKRVQLISKAEQCLKKFRYEITRSSTDTDPATNLPYMRVSGVEGSREITFKRVVSFVEKAGEVIPVWSSDITFRLENGSAIREQDGVETVAVRGASSLDFEIDNLGRVRCELTVLDLHSKPTAPAVTRVSTIHAGF